MTKIRTSLERHQANTPWNDEELRKKAASLWHSTGGKTVMVRLDWIENSLDRQMLQNFGNMTFGKIKEGAPQ